MVGWIKSVLTLSIARMTVRIDLARPLSKLPKYANSAPVAVSRALPNAAKVASASPLRTTLNGRRYRASYACRISSEITSPVSVCVSSRRSQYSSKGRCIGALSVRR
jgi:hypothetical protein